MEKKQVSLIEIAKVFLTIGTTGFGGGVAILALMQEYAVKQKKWLTSDEFCHGVALGQFLGPFATNAAIFIGYRTKGFIGGVVSLLSFILPSVTFVIILSALYIHYQKLPSLQFALKSINPVVLGLILSAIFQMGKGKFKSLEPILLVVLTVFLSVILKLQVISIMLLAILYGFIKARFFKTEDVA